jgi:predicted nucleic acid-binding Zn ribbon protein
VSDEEPAGEPAEPAAAPGPQGPDLVRAALSQARAAARARGATPGTPGRRPRRPGPVRSGSGPDARDPMPFGQAIRRLVEERGWQDTTAAASVLARWDELVGPELAEHCRPASLLDGELVLVAESSAWATQLRLLTRTLQARLAAQVGEGVVTSVVVRGPAQPDWRKGPRRVRGRGPRDTYG